MIISENIKSLRTSCQISQTELANLLDIDASTVAKWESGAAVPRTEKLPEIAKALNCEIADLFEEV